ncbi:MAG: phosphoribosylamine--glycine ligase [Bacteroidales bacterium]|jgi:phosphoribosylamine--glycine ligase|nr:phosphoribosylamine--glycine ligase [Bacteroidales bacterium]
MNVLIIGAGGREHALGWKIGQSKQCEHLFFAPGNAGTRAVGTNIPLDTNDFEGLRKLCIEEQIKLVVVGPEQPLVEGIVDFFKADDKLNDIAIIGPCKTAAQLEGSKAFAKQFMLENAIPTAGAFEVNQNNIAEGIDYLRSVAAPYVLKADGLAAGKGVLILHSLEEAEKELKAMLKGKFGEASEKVVIEQFLSGIELSVFVLTDGTNYKILPSAKDYKRIGEGDTGPNTGGMGAVSPVIFADKHFMEKVEQRIVVPTMEGLKKRGIVYKGFLFIGLMNVQGDPFVIEYNVRLGDPEAECILPRIQSDMLSLLKAVWDGNLNEQELETDDRHAVTVVMVSGGYPGNYKKGFKVSGLDATKECVVFHAGTSIDVETAGVKTSGGRVFAFTALDYSIESARKTVYKNVKKVEFKASAYRKDIGEDLMSYKK